MNERMFLLCEVLEKIDNKYKLRSYLQDGMAFEVIVPEQEVELISPGPPPSAWLAVESSGERYGDVSITLPAPILDKGHKITVSMDRVARTPFKPVIKNK